MAEIGAVLGVSESRVCQRHAEIIEQLREPALGSSLLRPGRLGRSATTKQVLSPFQLAGTSATHGRGSRFIFADSQLN